VNRGAPLVEYRDINPPEVDSTARGPDHRRNTRVSKV
jgi:hypothetical protein